MVKSDLTFNLQTDIIFGGNDGAKVNKFLDCLISIVIASLHADNIYFVLPSFTARPIRWSACKQGKVSDYGQRGVPCLAVFELTRSLVRSPGR